MQCRQNLSDAMATIAVIGIYLAALHALTLGPSDDVSTTSQQLVSFLLLFFIMPCHITAAWAGSPVKTRDLSPRG